MGEEAKSVKAKQFATDLNSRGVGFSNVMLFFFFFCFVVAAACLRYHLPGEPNSAVKKMKKRKSVKGREGDERYHLPGEPNSAVEKMKKRKSVKGREGDERNQIKRVFFFLGGGLYPFLERES